MTTRSSTTCDPLEGPRRVAADRAVGIATPREVAGCFERYRPEGWTARLAAKNLEAKLARSEYAAQLAALSAARPGSYDLAENVAMAAALIDVCAEATQPAQRWRRVLSSEGTASDILAAWSNTLGAGSPVNAPSAADAGEK